MTGRTAGMNSGRALLTMWVVCSAMSWIDRLDALRSHVMRSASDGQLLCQTDHPWLAFLRDAARDPLEVALMGLVPSLVLLVVGVALFRAMRRA